MVIDVKKVKCEYQHSCCCCDLFDDKYLEGKIEYLCKECGGYQYYEIINIDSDVKINIVNQ